MDQKHPGGRRSALTPERQETICQLIRAGNYIRTAAAQAGLTETTIYAWSRRGQADIDAGNENSPHAQFHLALMRAEAQSEALRVVRIQRAGEQDWRADAWFLERRFPERWAARPTLTLAGEVGLTVDAELVVDPRALDLGEQMLDALLSARSEEPVVIDAEPQVRRLGAGELAKPKRERSKVRVLPDAPVKSRAKAWQVDGGTPPP